VTAWQNLAVEQNNDVLFTLNLTGANGAPFDLTGYTPTLYLKATETTADASAITFTTSTGLTVVSTKLGKVTWALPHADTATPSTQWWRIDVVDGSSNRSTLMVGNFTIQAV
jgi:hypothetical protein